jgi:hypothetical protein
MGRGFEDSRVPEFKSNPLIRNILHLVPVFKLVKHARRVPVPAGPGPERGRGGQPRVMKPHGQGRGLLRRRMKMVLRARRFLIDGA